MLAAPPTERFIVEFSKSEPQILAARQQKVRSKVEKAGGRIISSTDRLIVTLTVEVDAKTAAKIKAMAGVVRVDPEKTFKALPAK